MSGARRLVVVRGSGKRLMNGLVKLTALRRRRGRKKATIGLSHVSRSQERRGLGMNPRGVGVNAASCAVSHAEATIMAEYETALLHCPFLLLSMSSEDRIPY